MTIVYAVDGEGRFLGVFDGVEPPDGYISVPIPPSDGRQLWDFIAQKWLSLQLDKEQFDDLVTFERDRRIDAGFLFNGKLFQSRATDRENILGNAQLAFMAVSGGAEEKNLRWADVNSDFSWIAADNSMVTMDAQTMLAFAKASAAQKARLIFRAREIKDLVPRPADVTDDKLWE